MVRADLPTLDCHAHFRPDRTQAELLGAGAVMASTLSLDEAAKVVSRRDPLICWGVGCHPRFGDAQAAFHPGRFRDLARQAAFVGEVGLDLGSRVPLDIQLRNFREILAAVADLNRAVSIHSYRATRPVLDELRRTPVPAPILHWWTGSADETQEAVELGCRFSIHSAVARHSKFRTRVPAWRVLLESDHGWNDPPAAIPCRIGWVEYLVAQQYQVDVADLRRLVWRNLRVVIEQTHTEPLLPEALRLILSEIELAKPEGDRAKC